MTGGHNSKPRACPSCGGLFAPTQKGFKRGRMECVDWGPHCEFRNLDHGSRHPFLRCKAHGSLSLSFNPVGKPFFTCLGCQETMGHEA